MLQSYVTAEAQNEKRKNPNEASKCNGDTAGGGGRIGNAVSRLPAALRAIVVVRFFCTVGPPKMYSVANRSSFG